MIGACGLLYLLAMFCKIPFNVLTLPLTSVIINLINNMIYSLGSFANFDIFVERLLKMYQTAQLWNTWYTHSGTCTMSGRRLEAVELPEAPSQRKSAGHIVLVEHL